MPSMKASLAEHISFAGLPGAALAELLSLHGHFARFVEGLPGLEAEERFLSDLKRCLASLDKTDCQERMLVSFGRESMGMIGSGHFAPVAGFHPQNSRVLLLESNSWRYPEKQWVSIHRLWKACCTTTGYGFRRGYILVSRGVDHVDKC